MTIHHATTTKARKLGFEILEIDPNSFRLQDAEGATSQLFASPKEAVDAIKANTLTMVSTKIDEELADEVDEGVDAEMEIEAGSEVHRTGRIGMMVADYHRRYMQQGGGSGDLVDVALRAAVRGEDGAKVDVDLVRHIGIRNDLWNPNWEALNPGMQRMNLANRIRGFLRNSEDGAVTIGDESGRFGVDFNEKTRRPKKERTPRAASVPGDSGGEGDVAALDASPATYTEAPAKPARAARVNRDAADRARSSARSNRK